MRSVVLRGLALSALMVALGSTGGAQQAPAAANDPRIGLKPGLKDAGVAARHMELVSTHAEARRVLRSEGSAGTDHAAGNPAHAGARGHGGGANDAGRTSCTGRDPRRRLRRNSGAGSTSPTPIWPSPAITSSWGTSTGSTPMTSRTRGGRG